MNKFYIITNQLKDKSLEITYRIKAYLEQNGKTCILAVEQAQMPEGTDCVFVLGGDGTLIRAARELCTSNVPILGINMGTLGYLTEAEVHGIEETLEQVMQAKPQVEERMMLKGTLLNGKLENIALNDIVVTRAGALRLIHFNIYVNGELLNTYRADGVIISTPTGSTAYNLSAGGPIVAPTASMIVVTPICSHALNASSIVLSAEDEIVIEIGQGREESVEQASVAFDGECNIDMHTGDCIVIRKAEETTKLLKLSKVSFLEILRKKMKGN